MSVSSERSTPTTYCFELFLVSEPGALERVLGEFTRRDIVPARVEARPAARPDLGPETAVLEVWADTSEPHMAEVVAAKLSVLPCVIEARCVRVAGLVIAPKAKVAA